MKTILFTKESWMRSQLSVAKYSGGVQIEDEDGKKRTDEINPRKQIITSDKSGRVTDIRFAVIASKSAELVNTQIYVIKKDLLINLVENAYARGLQDFEKDVLLKQIDTLKIYSHEITSYAAIIDDIPGYYKHSMELLDAETRNDVFYGEGTIFTKDFWKSGTPDIA